MIPKLEAKQYKETGLDDLLRMSTDTGPRLLSFGGCPLCPARAGRRETSTAHPTRGLRWQRLYSCSQVPPDAERHGIGQGRQAPPPASSHAQAPTDMSGPMTFSVFRSSLQPNSCSSTWSSQRDILHFGPRFNNQKLF